MSSREKRLTIPAALAVVLLVPAAMSCGSAPSPCYCYFTDGGAFPGPGSDAGPQITCSGDSHPLLEDPHWSCVFF